MLELRSCTALRCGAILALAGLLGAFVLAVRRLAQEPLEAAAPAAVVSAAAPPRVPFAFTSNAECQPCHAEIYAEWAGDQHALSWFNQPLLAQDPKLTECNNCHAPEPILETGLGELAVIRTQRFEEGVGCLECHRNGDHVEGPLPDAEAPCNPVQNAVFAEASVCNPCHAAHGSYAEWQASEFPAQGRTCQACHMPEIERASAVGGPVRRVRSHRMRTQREPAMLREGMTLDVQVSGGRALVSLANTGTGHHIPGEIFNRELFVTTRVRAPGGEELAGWRESLKAVRREQRSTEASTQLPAGATRTWSYALPAGPGTLEVALGYKLFYLLPDASAEVVHARTLAF